MNFINSDNSNHKSLRIRTNIGDTFLNVNLDQTYESLDILSLKIFQKDIYRLFDADYGVIVGRVLGQGVGIPNAKISVFVSSQEENITNPTTLDDIKKIEAAAIYPFQTVYDKDGNGKVYNLLPKYRKFRGLNGFIENDFQIGVTPKTPVGTFPEKEEILTNETFAYVYDKYYKYSTVTNESGDYILVVPSNRTYTINMSCDVTDIGAFSTSPSVLKSQGYPDNFFTEDGAAMNPDIPLEELPNIDIQNQTITVKPLWSQNPDNTNVGINRLDFFLIKKVQPFATIIANYFTMGEFSFWNGQPFDANPYIDGNSGTDSTYYNNTFNEFRRLGRDSQIRIHEKGNFDLRIFSIKNTVSETDADILNDYTNTNFANTFDKYNYDEDITLLDNSKYIEYKENGNLVIVLPCNRNKIITNEFGEIVSVGDDNEIGVFTSFRGYFWFDTHDYFAKNLNNEEVRRIKLKVPQLFGYNENVVESETFNCKRPWIWKHFKFDFGEIYGISQLNETKFSNILSDSSLERYNNQTNILNFGYILNNSNGYPEDNDVWQERINANTFFPEYINFYNHVKVPRAEVGVVQTSYASQLYQFSLKNQWMNFSIYFLNFGFGQNRGDQQAAIADDYIFDRTQSYPKTNERGGIGGGVTKIIDINVGNGLNRNVLDHLANGKHIKTQFFKANKEDLLKLYDYKVYVSNVDTEVEQLGIKLPQNELKGVYPRMENKLQLPVYIDPPPSDILSGNGRLKYLSQDKGDNFGERYFLLGQYTTTNNGNDTNETLQNSLNKNNIIKYLFDTVKIF